MRIVVILLCGIMGIPHLCAAQVPSPSVESLSEAISVALVGRDRGSNLFAEVESLSLSPRGMSSSGQLRGGANGMDVSTYLLSHEPFERRLFEVALVDEDTGPLDLLRACAKGQLPCTTEDIGAIQIITNLPDSQLLVARVELERPTVYRLTADCVFLSDDSGSDPKWTIAYVGVKNRLSDDISMSRPVFYMDPRWEDVGLHLWVSTEGKLGRRP